MQLCVNNPLHSPPMRVGVGYKLRSFSSVCCLNLFCELFFVLLCHGRLRATFAVKTSTGAGYCGVLPGVVCVGAWQLLSTGHKGEQQLGGAGQHRHPATPPTGHLIHHNTNTQLSYVFEKQI